MKLRWIFCFLTALLLCACVPPLLAPRSTGDAALFMRGLDEWTAAGSLETLQQLQAQRPQGEWQVRAAMIVALAEQQQLQQEQLARLQEELSGSRQTEQDLLKENQQLERTLEQLKQVLIDMELRPE